MARDRSPERDKAREIWLESGGKMTAKQVAEAVGGVKPEQVRKWKSLDSWAAALEAQKPPRKRGGQPGNRFPHSPTLQSCFASRILLL